MSEKNAATYWHEGHAATDEHGDGLCECPNPYGLRRPCPEPDCIKSVEHPRDRHCGSDGRRWGHPDLENRSE